MAAVRARAHTESARRLARERDNTEPADVIETPATITFGVATATEMSTKSW